MVANRCILFEAQELLPTAWSGLADGCVWAFNPALMKLPSGWLMASRIVGSDQERRIAFCRLDARFRVVRGSQVAFSDLMVANQPNRLPLIRRWFADPRLYRFGRRMFLYWNSGWHAPRNAQYLQEFDAGTLRPIGPSRELVLDGPRRPLEKNWSLFGDGPVYAIYSVTPHSVLELSFDRDDVITARQIEQTDGPANAYSDAWGELRGGAPPVASGDRYYSFCHSLQQTPAGARYLPAVYAFNASLPFQPVLRPTRPLRLGNPLGATTMLPRLNAAVAEVIYPSGAAFEDGHFIVSYGINDERCAIAVIREADVLATLV